MTFMMAHLWPTMVKHDYLDSSVASAVAVCLLPVKECLQFDEIEMDLYPRKPFLHGTTGVLDNHPTCFTSIFTVASCLISLIFQVWQRCIDNPFLHVILACSSLYLA